MSIKSTINDITQRRFIGFTKKQTNLKVQTFKYYHIKLFN